jgi:hypothetical protein
MLAFRGHMRLLLISDRWFETTVWSSPRWWGHRSEVGRVEAQIHYFAEWIVLRTDCCLLTHNIGQCFNSIIQWFAYWVKSIWKLYYQSLAYLCVVDVQALPLNYFNLYTFICLVCTSKKIFLNEFKCLCYFPCHSSYYVIFGSLT